MFTQILISSALFTLGIFTGKHVAFKQVVAIIEKHSNNEQ